MSSAEANLRLTSVIYLAKAFSFGLSFIIRTKSERFCDNINIDKTQNNRPKPELLIGIVSKSFLFCVRVKAGVLLAY
tara:strand:- start:713 stop:943 length:231 start_codon:yes stop_codon:yes gene_type:complete